MKAIGNYIVDKEVLGKGQFGIVYKCHAKKNILWFLLITILLIRMEIIYMLKMHWVKKLWVLKK